MPSIQNPLGALPSRFRRQRILIVGCGDVGLRAAKLLAPRTRVLALTSQPGRVEALRAASVVPLAGNLDQPLTLARLAGLATRVLHLAPPRAQGELDLRTRALARVLRQRTPPDALVYGSTSGVYGDCGGAWVSETRALQPRTPRARRRTDAEAAIRMLGRSSPIRVSLMRIPGIYAPDRIGGTPRERLMRGTPVLEAADDVFTNHIHADDLARACVLALWRGRPQRAYNVSDDTQLKMGDYMDLAATIYGLSAPPRVSRERAGQLLTPMQLSFLGESRRLDNRRMKRELRLRLAHPTVAQGLIAE